MVKNLSIGRYIKTNSPIHKLDPRTKIIGIIIFITLLMISSTWQHYTFLSGYTFLLIFLTRIPILIFLKGIKPLLRIIIFTALLQILFSSSGTIYWQWGPFTISEIGIRSAVVVFLRFSLIIMMTSVVGLSTKPLELTAGMEKLLFPFKLLGFAVHDLAFMMSIALRFIPTLFDEANRLKKAQESRGMQFDEGNFFERMKKFLPLLVPIFVGSFYRAIELSNALDVRGYSGSAKRTKFKVMKFNYRDAMFAGGLGILLIVYFMVQ